MTTIMAVGNSESTRRCDSRCHTAKTSRCTCICQGRYHGCGSSAVAQEWLTDDWLGRNLTEALKEAVRTGNDALYRQLVHVAENVLASAAKEAMRTTATQLALDEETS